MDLQKRLWIAMIFLGACTRLLPHPWNFTPLIAIGLFAGHHARNTSTGILATVLAMALGDAVLGFDSSFWYVYPALMIPVFAGRLTRNRNGMGTVGSIAAAALGSGLAFFAITNFGVWLTQPIYPHTAAGLAACFAAGIPFYRNQLAGDALYTLALFGGYAAFIRLFRPAPQAA
jgi:hypothetical protein